MIENENLPALPRSWIWVKLNEITTVASGGTPSTKEPKNFGGEIPWITPADLSSHRDKYIEKGSRNITELGLNTSSATLLPKGSIIFSSRAPIGYAAIAKNEYTTNQGCKNFIPSEAIFNEYLYHYLKGNKSLAENYASGTTFLELSAKRASRIPVPLPPYNEQKRIVNKIEELFTKLDDSIKDLESVKRKLGVYRKSVLKAAFDGKLSDVNDEWLESKINEIVKVRYGKGLPERERNKNGTIPVYGSAGNVGLHNNFLIDFPTIIVARKGSVGNNFIVKKPCWPIDTVYYLENINVDIDYLFYVLNFSIFKDTSTAVPSLRRDDLENIPIKYPSKKENQKQIVQEIESRFSVIDKLEETVDIALKKTEKLRKSILKSAFEGKLVPQDPTDEPAEILLKRIKNENQKFEQMRLT